MSTNPSNGTAITAYREASATRAMRAAPRFGHTDQISVLFDTDDASQRDDYLRGLVFIGAFILAFFLVWMLVLLVFKCCGRKRVGFLSGAPMQKKSSVVDYNRPFRVRVAFVNAVLIFVVFAILLVVNGVTNLQDTVVAVSNSNQEVMALLGDAGVITRDLRRVGRSSGEVRDELVSNLGNFCPNEPNIAQTTGYDFDALAQDAINLLQQLGDFIDTDVANVQDGIDTTHQTTADIEEAVNDIDVHDWQSLLIIIPFVLLPAFMLVGVLMAWFDASIGVVQCLLSWLVMPLFILVTIVGIVACSSTAYLAVANADLCSGGPENTPDGTVMEVLRVQNLNQTGIVFEAVEYYVSQCTTADPWMFVRDYQTQVVDAEQTVRELNTAFEQVTVPRLNLLCGKDFGPLQTLLQTMDGNLNVLNQSATSALRILSCERILPIYTSSVYGATCDYSITGVTWTFASLLVLATMGTIMITLRSAYLDVEDEYVMGSVDMYAPSEDSYPKMAPRREEVTMDDEIRRGASEDSVEHVYAQEQPSAPYASRTY